MARRRRYTRRVKAVKYSNETYNCPCFVNCTDVTSTDPNPNIFTMIAHIEQLGTRKCKNFELSLTRDVPYNYTISGSGASTQYTKGEAAIAQPLLWALVYIPQGTSARPLQVGSSTAAASLYEPNQNVIISGIIPTEIKSVYRFKTRLARNLNSGDQIALVIRPLEEYAGDGTHKVFNTVLANLNYAISF